MRLDFFLTIRCSTFDDFHPVEVIFSQLVHLELNIKLCQVNVSLILRKLQVLAIHEFNEFCVLSVDCPVLRVLVYRGEFETANLLDLVHLANFSTI